MYSEMSRAEELLSSAVVVLNVGLRHFYDALREQHVKVIQLEWSPPHDVEQELKDILDKLL